MNYNDLSFLTLSQKYLHTSKVILEQMVDSGNQHMITSDHPINYEELTKWSDFNILIPTIFIFYHGIELLLKGLLFINNSDDKSITQNQHVLSNLLKNVDKKYKNEEEIIYTLKKYIINKENTPIIIKDFINKNKDINTIDDLYSVLRYPTDKTLKKEYQYFNLYYKESEGIPFAQELITDIKNLLRNSTRIYREKNKANSLI